MKTRYVDLSNCDALLPYTDEFPLAEELEKCLCRINDNHPQYKGFINSLRLRNFRSVNSDSFAPRLTESALEICQVLNLGDRPVSTMERSQHPTTPSMLHIGIQLNENFSWKVMVPLQYLLKGWGDANKGYQGYMHSISHNMPHQAPMGLIQNRLIQDKDSFYYVGITSRNWLQRLKEHLKEVHRGSRRKFYRAWRESLGMKNVLFTSALQPVNMTFEMAMIWEEYTVDQKASDQYGLNMVAGGFKGMRELHRLGYTNKSRVSIDERDRAIGEFARRNPLKGIPNPFMKERWEDDAHFEKVITSNEKFLNPSQVRKIRELHAGGLSLDEITKEVEASGVDQVKRVISGKTYSRVR